MYTAPCSIRCMCMICRNALIICIILQASVLYLGIVVSCAAYSQRDCNDMKGRRDNFYMKDIPKNRVVLIIQNCRLQNDELGCHHGLQAQIETNALCDVQLSLK